MITLPGSRDSVWYIDDSAEPLVEPWESFPSGHIPRFPPGHKHGTLTVVEYRKAISGPGGNSAKGYHPFCKCDCGWEGMMLRTNFAKSRKCWFCTQKSDYRHIVPDEKLRVLLLRKLCGARQRCYNKRHDNYVSYGARGIKVHEGWLADKGSFLGYAITLPGWDNPSLQLDRIDVDGNYEPGNIRFVTAKENALNRRVPNKLSKRIADLEAEVEMLRDENARLKKILSV